MVRVSGLIAGTKEGRRVKIPRSPAAVNGEWAFVMPLAVRLGRGKPILIHKPEYLPLLISHFCAETEDV